MQQRFNTRNYSQGVSLRSDPTPDLSPSESISLLPGALVSVVLLSGAIATWPVVLERAFSLEWQLGNVRPFAYGLHILFDLLTLGSFLVQRLYRSGLDGQDSGGKLNPLNHAATCCAT